MLKTTNKDFASTVGAVDRDNVGGTHVSLLL